MIVLGKIHICNLNVFSPNGKKFRSRTELEKYVEDGGIEVDPQSIDFTVRGKKFAGEAKPKSLKKKVKPTATLTLKNKSDKKKFKFPTPKLKDLKQSKSPKKSMSQKLVVKMRFASPFKVTKSAKDSCKKITIIEEDDSDDHNMNIDEKEESDLEDDLVKIKQPPPPPVEIKKQTATKLKSANKHENSNNYLEIKCPSNKRRISADKKYSEKMDKTSERRKSSDVKQDRRKSSESKSERKKSTEAKLEQRKSADKRDSGKSKKTEAINELQVLENIRASSRSARYKKKQEEIRESQALLAEEQSDEDEVTRDVLGKYEPYEDYDNEGRSVS